MPAIIFSSVVFPQPFPPIRPTFSPRLSLKLTPSSNSSISKRLQTLFTSRTVMFRNPEK